MKAIFWDRDGTLIEHYPKGKYTVLPKHITLKPDFDCIQTLQEEFTFFLLTNAGGIGRKYFTPEEFWEGEAYFEKLAQEYGVKFKKCCPAFWNPKAPKNFIELKPYRKPEPKFILEIAQEFPALDLKNSWVIGDSKVDMEVAQNAGCKKIFVKDKDDDLEHACYQKTKPEHKANNLKEVVQFLKSQTRR